MVAMVHDPALAAELIRQRRRTGTDRYDEVWDGVYVISPLATDEHQGLVNRLTTVLTLTVEFPGLGVVRPGVNVSDRRKGWKKNYRCPDVVAFLNGKQAVNYDTFWHSGPDFAAEVTSPGEQILEKLRFYEKVGTRELLVIARDPWALTLYRLRDGRFEEAGRSEPADPQVVSSDVVPLTYQFRGGAARPQIEVATRDGTQRWSLTAPEETRILFPRRGPMPVRRRRIPRERGGGGGWRRSGAPRRALQLSRSAEWSVRLGARRSASTPAS